MSCYLKVLMVIYTNIYIDVMKYFNFYPKRYEKECICCM